MIQKVYFSIPEVARQLGVADSHVRHYMKEFNIEGKGGWNKRKRLTDDQVMTLGVIHHEATVEGRHYWKIRELLGIKANV